MLHFGHHLFTVLFCRCHRYVCMINLRLFSKIIKIQHKCFNLVNGYIKNITINKHYGLNELAHLMANIGKNKKMIANKSKLHFLHNLAYDI